MNSALLRKILSLKAFAIAVGVLIMLYGLSLATDFRLEELVSMAKSSIGIALLHDMVWLPVTVAVGKLLTRLPGWVRTPIAAGAGLTVALTLVFLPFVLGYGRRSNNPSLLPRNYTTGWLSYLAVVWLACSVGAAFGWWRTRGRSAPSL